MNDRHLLAANVRKLMAADPNLDSQAKVAAASGGRVSQKTVSNILNVTGHAPTLDSISGLAHAFRVRPWNLLHPTLGIPLPKGQSEDEFYSRLDEAMAAIKAIRRP